MNVVAMIRPAAFGIRITPSLFLRFNSQRSEAATALGDGQSTVMKNLRD
jgi:hypothetical protein